jgi:7-cyano-7-deazaguanine synthase
VCRPKYAASGTPMSPDSPTPPGPTLVLLSGGLDSAVLLAHEARRAAVLPVYVSVGLAWEQLELAMVDPTARPSVCPARTSVRWPGSSSRCATSTRRRTGPFGARRRPTTRRTRTSISRGGISCCWRRPAWWPPPAAPRRIALGPLAGNPFPDARPAFFAAMQEARSLGLDHAIEVAAPFSTMEKEDVIRRVWSWACRSS